MLKTLTIVLGLAAFAGCKTDAPASSEKSSETTAEPAAKGRSGKIVLPNAPHAERPGLPDDQARTEGDRDTVSQQAREERRRQRMSELDTDGDGEISDEERAAARAKREAEMLERLDKNKDGKIDDAERDAARKDRANEMHARLDKNGDGKLSLDEMSTGRMGRMADPSIDTNGDGDISADELDAMMKNRPMRGPGRRGGWNRGDGAGSGLGVGSGQIQ